MSELSPIQEKIFNLAKQGLTNPQIAERLGKTPAAVKSALRKALMTKNLKTRKDIPGYGS